MIALILSLILITIIQTKGKRRKLKKDIVKLHQSKDIETQDKLLNTFGTFRYENLSKISDMNHDARRKNDSCNIQNFEYSECNTLF